MNALTKPSDPQQRVRHPQSAAAAASGAARRNPTTTRSSTRAAIRAQKELWSLQGAGGVWFCGAHFGAGFHEDGLQSGLAVAEQLGGVRRPWRVAERIRHASSSAPRRPRPPDREEAA